MNKIISFLFFLAAVQLYAGQESNQEDSVQNKKKYIPIKNVQLSKTSGIGQLDR